MRTEEFFSRLWVQYVQMAPTAAVIRSRMEAQFGRVENDHVAFRTFDLSPIALAELEKAFLDWGYVRDRAYEFPDKHLKAFGYIPPRETLPLVFLSEFETASLPERERKWVTRVVSELEQTTSPIDFLLGGRPWKMPTLDEYARLERESAYAAWLSVWGLCANHFTVAVHRLTAQPSLGDVVEYLQAAGFAMNDVGGVFKGTPSDLLEQASTLAESRPVTFADGKTGLVPSCYYEFARRYPERVGRYYPGFVAQSASNIFESTTRRDADTASEGGMGRGLV